MQKSPFKFLNWILCCFLCCKYRVARIFSLINLFMTKKKKSFSIGLIGTACHHVMSIYSWLFINLRKEGNQIGKARREKQDKIKIKHCEIKLGVSRLIDVSITPTMSYQIKNLELRTHGPTSSSLFRRRLPWGEEDALQYLLKGLEW